MASPSKGVGVHADYFLKIQGIDGESAAKNHTNEIDLLSFSWGEDQVGTAGTGKGAGMGKVQMQNFAITKFVDKASPSLFLYCANGKHIPEVTLSCQRAGGSQEVYLKVEMKEVIVSSYHTNGSNTEMLPTEAVTFNFAKIAFSYWPQEATGASGGVIKKGWDLQQNAEQS